jgi:AraC-like DNA-binding protein
MAHRMLVNRRFDSLSVGDIALDAGFDDLSYFNRLFRRRFSLTPKRHALPAAETGRHPNGRAARERGAAPIRETEEAAS